MLAQRCLVGAAATSKVLAYVGETNSDTNATVYTFSAHAVGTASAGRRNIVAAHAQNGTGGVASMTIGGDSATELVDAINVSCVAALYIMLNTAGTSEDIVVTFDQAHTTAAVGVWESTGLADNTALDTDSSTAAAPAATLTTTPGGFVVAATSNQIGSSSAWSGTGVTERYDDQTGDTGDWSGADAVTTGNSLAITNTITSNNRQVGVFASF